MAAYLWFVLVVCPHGNLFKFGLIAVIKIRNFLMKFQATHTKWTWISLWKQLAEQWAWWEEERRTVTCYFRWNLSELYVYHSPHHSLCPVAKAWCHCHLSAFSSHTSSIYVTCFPAINLRAEASKLPGFSTYQAHKFCWVSGWVWRRPRIRCASVTT